MQAITNADGPPEAGPPVGPSDLRRSMVMTAIAVVAVDQATKTVVPWLDRTAPDPLIDPGLNPAYSLGVLHGPRPLLVIGTLVAAVLAGTWAARSVRAGRVPGWAAGLLVGGALSNVIDRIVRGGVLDFIATPWIALNLADLAVVAGLCWLFPAHRSQERG